MDHIAQMSAAIHPITVQPASRLTAKMPFQFDVCRPTIEGKQYNGTPSRNSNMIGAWLHSKSTVKSDARMPNAMHTYFKRTL